MKDNQTFPQMHQQSKFTIIQKCLQIYQIDTLLVSTAQPYLVATMAANVTNCRWISLWNEHYRLSSLTS